VQGTPAPRAPITIIEPSVEPSLPINTGVADAPPRRQFVKPSLAEVAAYCAERKNAVDPERWFDHYTSNGWRVGKNHMRDWKAAVRTWEKTSGGNSNGKNQQPDTRSRAKRFSDKLDEIARRDIEQKGFADKLG
jgi:hypothetical protein